MTDLKYVPLHAVHQQLGAKMVPFAGFEMPVRYTSDTDEHLAVRQRAGVFDVSHMGEFRVHGPGALDLLQRVLSNDVAKLYDGKVQYAYLPNDQGGVVDDLVVYRLAHEDYLLVVNASNIDKDWEWISRHNTAGVAMQNLSDATALLAVQGPLAARALQPLTTVDLAAMEYYTFQVADFAGVPGVIISATGYTGAGGFELYVPAAQVELVWNRVLAAGAVVGLQPVGLGARDTLRLEMGYCLYGHELTDTTSPLEAGLGWVTKFNKPFVNADNLKKEKEAGIARKLVAFTMDERAIPRQHYPILSAAGAVIGEVTSGTQSPLLGRGIGLGYVPVAYGAVGTSLFIQIRDKAAAATVVKLPFVTPAL